MCFCVSNRTQKRNFPLKNLDGPPQGVRALTSRSTVRMTSTPSPIVSTAGLVPHMHSTRRSKSSPACLNLPLDLILLFIKASVALHF